jgi:hypothetical protein
MLDAPVPTLSRLFRINLERKFDVNVAHPAGFASFVKFA